MTKYLQILELLVLSLISTSTAECSIFKRTSAKRSKPEMVIKRGSFKMGDFYEQSNLDETPLHIVSLSDFKIGKYEVTYR